jgi:hypothetical protein
MPPFNLLTRLKNSMSRPTKKTPNLQKNVFRDSFQMSPRLVASFKHHKLARMFEGPREVFGCLGMPIESLAPNAHE